VTSLSASFLLGTKTVAYEMRINFTWLLFFCTP